MTEQLDTRTRLLNTALQLIWANSYGRVSVEEICEEAGAKKGSFYHFFKSKAELAKAALEKSWQDMRIDFDRIFSPAVSPLDRLRDYSTHSCNMQREMASTLGYVPGCPWTSLGSEQYSEDDGLREKANDLLLRLRKYFASAIRDALQEGTIRCSDYETKADEIFTYYTGANALARVSNSLAPMESLWKAWEAILFSEGQKTSSKGEQAA